MDAINGTVSGVDLSSVGMKTSLLERIGFAYTAFVVTLSLIAIYAVGILASRVAFPL